MPTYLAEGTSHPPAHFAPKGTEPHGVTAIVLGISPPILASLMPRYPAEDTSHPPANSARKGTEPHGVTAIVLGIPPLTLASPPRSIAEADNLRALAQTAPLEAARRIVRGKAIHLCAAKHSRIMFVLPLFISFMINRPVSLNPLGGFNE